MIDFMKVVDYMDGIIVLTEDREAMEEFEYLITSLVNADDPREIKVLLKLLEGWAYSHPKELNQIKEQIKWRVMKNA